MNVKSVTNSVSTFFSGALSDLTLGLDFVLLSALGQRSYLKNPANVNNSSKSKQSRDAARVRRCFFTQLFQTKTPLNPYRLCLPLNYTNQKRVTHGFEMLDL